MFIGQEKPLKIIWLNKKIETFNNSGKIIIKNFLKMNKES